MRLLGYVGNKSGNTYKFEKESYSMTDCKGKELNVGDEVVFIRGKNSFASLDTGNITKFYKSRYGEDECSVGGQSHILSFRIMKL